MSSKYKKHEATHKIRFTEEELLDFEQAWDRKNRKKQGPPRKGGKGRRRDGKHRISDRRRE